MKELQNHFPAAEETQKRILACRTAEAALTVLGTDGLPLADAPLTVRQVRHRFLFGCNAYMLGQSRLAEHEQAYRDRFAGLMNFATLPFYWGAYEPQQDQPQEARLTAMAQWCVQQGIRTKGHPLCWHEVAPPWLASKTPQQIEDLQRRRITREMQAFRDVGTWDVVNEAVVMPDFRQQDNPIVQLCRRLGRVELIRRAFAEAQEANSRALLILNDYVVTEEYEKLLAEVLVAGVRIDAIGIQSHMHRGYWGAEKIWDVCQRFARFGKPLHFTETTLVSGALKTDGDYATRRTDWRTTTEGELRQAEEAAEFYTILFSHPAVEAITWWDFADQGAWMGAPAGMLREDMSPKPIYERLRDLIRRQWWIAPQTLRTDSRGIVTFRGFLGDYLAEGSAGEASFVLDAPGSHQRTIKLNGQ